MQPYILSIDQGTTSTRAIVFDANADAVSVAQQEFTQHYPQSGWVEHDAEEIWSTTLNVCRQAIYEAEKNDGQVVAIGITNQRETTVVWDRATGVPIHNAIVWQDRRTANICEELRTTGYEKVVQDKTGLLLDSYFSGTKIAWILDHVEGARKRAENNELAFGTTDSFLIWRLTGGGMHLTDATNASRTMLFDIHTNSWDDELLDIINVPRSLLPEVNDSAGHFGETTSDIFGRNIPICGVAGDQQAASVGQACFEKGMIKSTYGTGCFMMMNTGTKAIRSKNKLLTTIGYRLNGETHFALEGSIFNAGTTIQWLRDGINIIDDATASEDIAKSLKSNNGVYLVPAFTGLGAPHWDPNARGAIFGLTRDTNRSEFVRAALESVCYQTADLIKAMREDGNTQPNALRVDGGMVANNWMLQFLADVMDTPVERPIVTETTALGAAYLAGLQSGVYDSLDDIKNNWQRDRLFEPDMRSLQRDDLVSHWRDAVNRVLTV